MYLKKYLYSTITLLLSEFEGREKVDRRTVIFIFSHTEQNFFFKKLQKSHFFTSNAIIHLMADAKTLYTHYVYVYSTSFLGKRLHLLGLPDHAELKKIHFNVTKRPFFTNYGSWELGLTSVNIYISIIIRKSWIVYSVKRKIIQKSIMFIQINMHVILIFYLLLVPNIMCTPFSSSPPHKKK